jgi:hypothetical protein
MCFCICERVCAHLCTRECSKRRARRLRVQRRVHGAQRRHVHGVRDRQVQGLAGGWCMHRMSRQLRVACRFVRPLLLKFTAGQVGTSGGAPRSSVQKPSSHIGHSMAVVLLAYYRDLSFFLSLSLSFFLSLFLSLSLSFSVYARQHAYPCD